MSTETDSLDRLYAAIDRNDVDAAAAEFHPDIERVEPEGFPASGTYRGVDVVREHIARGRGTWAEGTCRPEAYRVKGNRVVADVHVRVRLHDAADWIDARFADGFEFRDGRIVRYQTFAERSRARAWAGIDD